ncbi:T9SS sorting signal type C domain-containing protein [Flavobacterium magnum]|nr:T9SS sorting signal type C domain-containing protein [Flavobacterium magnum]
MRKLDLKKWLHLPFIVVLFFFAGSKVTAQTTLAAGDLLFTGYDSTLGTNNASAADRFSFVLLTNISSGTVIYFTDRGYFTSSWQASGTSEGTIKWVSGSDLTVGAEVYITAYTATVNGTANGVVTQVLGGNAISGLNLSTAGDQLIAFQNVAGDPTATGTTFVAGLHWGTCSVASDANWDTIGTCAAGPTTSTRPAGLSSSTSTIWMGNPGTGGTYTNASFKGTGAPYANVAAARTAILTKANWNRSFNLTSGLPVVVPPGTVTFVMPPSITTHPANRAICAGSATTFSVVAAGNGIGYQWQLNSGSGYTNLSNGGVYSNVTTNTLVLTAVTGTMSGYLFRCVVTNADGSVNTNAATLTVSSMTTTGSQADVSCFGGNNGSATVNVTGGIGSYSYDWTPGNPSGDGTASVSGLAAGTYTVTITDAIGCTVSKTITITQPEQIIAIGLQTNVTCNSENDGTASVSVTGGSGTYSYAWFPSGGNAATATNLAPGSYTCFIFDTNGCSTSKGFNITEGGITTWDGVAWSAGYPNSNLKAIINADYTSTGDLSACGFVVNGTANVTVLSGHDFNIANKVVVAATASLTFQNNANLLQTNTLENSGNITLKRNAMMRRLEYVYWGAPVTGQQLQAFSPLTLSNRFYTLNETTNSFVQVADPATTNFVAPVGYMVRAPNTFLGAPAPKQLFQGTFTGTPNNGDFSIPVTANNGGFNLLGNPYPSPISADLFLQANPGTLYFWTHNVLGSGNANYATYNTVGTAAPNGGDVPNGTIQTGQGFLLLKAASGMATFNNTMRIGNNDGQFFRTNTENKSRFWLNLNNDGANVSQMLVGYLDGATLNIDESMDGKLIDMEGPSLSSLVDGAAFTIQGRPTPFQNTDTVKLNFKAAQSGNYTISLDHFDGVFADGAEIFLKDDFTGTLHNLKDSAYAFVSSEGDFADRFQVVFQNTTLGTSTASQDEKSVVVYNDRGVVHIKSAAFTINEVKIFDVQGRLIYYRDNVNGDNTTIENLPAASQILMVQIKSDAGGTVVKKIVR